MSEQELTTESVRLIQQIFASLGITPQDLLGVIVGVVGLMIIVPAYFRLIRSLIEGRREISYAFRRSTSLFNRLMFAAFRVGDFSSKEFKRSDRVKIEKELDDARLQVKALQEQLNFAQERGLRDEKGVPTSEWRAALSSTRERMLSETERLRNRSTVNLTIGLGFSVVAVFALVLLLFVVQPSETFSTISEFAASFLPRLTIVVMLQLTASFFLWMHVANENDIKQNKNEITNIDLKYVSGNMLGEGDAFKEVSISLAKEERNFILTKEQKVAGSSDSVTVETMMGILEKLVDKK